MSDDETKDTPSDDEVLETVADKAREVTKRDAKSDAKGKGGPGGKKDEKKGGLLGNGLFILGFLATLAGGYWLGQKIIEWTRDPVPVETGDRYKVALRGDEPESGPSDALVTIVEFSDFQCPYCAKAVEPLKEVLDDYDDEVRLIFKHYPLPGHGRAVPASKVAWAAHQQGKFWEFHDWLFESKAKIDDLPDMISKHGLDADRFGKDMESKEASDAIDQDMLDGGRVGVGGTPSFFVNGHFYSGARDARAWKDIIKYEIEQAEQLKDDGVDDVYAHLMKDALTERGGGAANGGKPSDRKRKRRPGEPNPDRNYRVAIDDRPQIGPDDALVTIVEFADFHCPFCQRVDQTVKQVQKGRPDDVRIVFRQRPLTSLHANARRAAKASVAFHKQGKFWEAAEKIFLRKAKNEADFKAIADEIGADWEKFQADFKDKSTEEYIQADEAIANHYGARGTPAFFINGRFISGAQPRGNFEALVDEEMAKAKKRLGAGIPRAEVYDAIMAEADTEVID